MKNVTPSALKTVWVCTFVKASDRSIGICASQPIYQRNKMKIIILIPRMKVNIIGNLTNSF